jgi:hypothetical protein
MPMLKPVKSLVDRLKIVVMECPYNTLAENPETKKYFSEYISFKLLGYSNGYDHGVLPLGAYDFIANAIYVCEETNSGLLPVQVFKSTTFKVCEYFNLPFEAYQLVNAPGAEKHSQAVTEILNRAKKTGKMVGYNSSWTVNPTWRQDPERKLIARELFLAMLPSYYRSYGIDEVILGSTMRFKVEKLMSIVGFESLRLGSEELPPIGCTFAHGERVQVQHLTKFSDESLRLAEVYSKVWKSRLVLADSSKFVLPKAA